MHRRTNALDRMLSDASKVGMLKEKGTFTIAGSTAIGKLAAFQLPRQSAWILKVVQAAVTSGASWLKICQSHQATTFEYDTDENFSIAALKEALLEPELSGPPSVRHLAVGLRTVGFGDKRAFTLAYDEGGLRTFLGWDGSKLVERAETVNGAEKPLLRLGVVFPSEDLGRSFAGLAKSKGRATREYLELVHNAEVCPIPLSIDGRRLDNLGAPPKDKVKGKLVTLSVGWTPLSGTDEVGLLLPKGVFEASGLPRATDKFTDSRTFHLDGPETVREVSSIVKLMYGFRVIHYGSKNREFSFKSQRRFSEYAWVKDGVVCHRDARLRASSPVSFQMYLPADDLRTDISGLTLLSSPKLEERSRRGRERLAFQIENTLEALNNHVPKPFKRDTILYGGIGALFGAMGVVTLGKTLLGAAWAGFALAFSAKNKKEVMDDCKHHLQRFGARVTEPETR